MKIGIVSELTKNENRVAITPDIAKKLSSIGFEIIIEKNAGIKSGFADSQYTNAKILSSAKEVYASSDIICKIWSPLETEQKFIKENQIIIANFQDLAFPNNKQIIAKRKATAFALDLLPRISRAQSMDILSSQSNLAGYKATIEAFSKIKKAIPLMMTSAGTVPPAKVLIFGVGVAGLQAIATAHRMGAQVFATDIRPETAEQVASLGAKFVSKEDIKNLLPSCDIIITTALAPNGKAPRLISKEQILSLPQNAILIDMAAKFGGNIEGSKENETTTFEGREIYGNSNFASQLPTSASPLFAKNIFNFISLLYSPETKEININFADELLDKTCICLQGELR